MSCALRQSDAEIQALSLANLQAVVRIDSQSDENSESVPTTPGQRVLSDEVARFFDRCGATVDRDEHANVVAEFAGRGAGAEASPLALMVHLDTARGTRNVGRLSVLPAWDGRPIPYPDNAALRVATDTYPAVAEFVGQDIVHGPGDAPFGLDDKLGLAHLMTLGQLLHTNPEIPHPPLFLVGRPDEEVGRVAPLVGLAQMLAARGVRSGYTVDGILPFEVNVENFNGAGASLRFAGQRRDELPRGASVELVIGGVNTHGCTARAEGYRAATRLASEIFVALDASRALPIAFASDPLRDCDAVVRFAVVDASDVERIASACRQVIGPHTSRGASWELGELGPAVASADDACVQMLTFVDQFLASRPGFPVAAEASDGRQGYSAPFRALPVEGGIQLDIRLRDFDAEGLEARKRHVHAHADDAAGVQVQIDDHYQNMGPRLAERGDLVEWARRAGAAIGVDVRTLPIRGGTGVDPFLDQGIGIANLGTGYFAPESEKEFTSLQMMAHHARWLCQLVAECASVRA